MSGMVECYLVDNDVQYDFSPAVTNTRVIFGKNQPFLCVEITVSKYMFDSDDFWAGQTQEGQTTLTRPNLTQNVTPVHIKTYGGTYDLIYTQTLNPDDMTYVFLCYTKMWQTKTTKVTSLMQPSVIWGGQSETYDSGNLTVTCDGFTSTTKVGETFLATGLPSGYSVRNVQLINQSAITSIKYTGGYLDKRYPITASVGTLRVLVPIYQDVTIPELPGQGGTELLPDYNNLEGTMRADTVYASLIFEYAGPLSLQDLTKVWRSATFIHPSNQVQQNIDGRMVTSSTTKDNGILYCKGIEYICGFGQALFAWVANKVGGYSGNQLTIDSGYTLETSSNILEKLDYTVSELEEYRYMPIEERTHGDIILKIQPDLFAYDLIAAIASATNRHAFFADTPYLSSFEITGDSALSQLNIQYTQSNGAYCAYFIPLGSTDPEQIVLGSGVEYNDQGSTYLVGSQTARSPNANVTVTVTDAGTDTAGNPIEVNLNTESIESSKQILAQVAFNRLVQNFHPSNTLSFIALENTSNKVDTDYIAYMKSGDGLPDPSADYAGKLYVNAGANDPNLYACNLVGGAYVWQVSVTPTANKTVTVHAPSNTYFFQYIDGVWEQFNYIVTVDRNALFRPDTRCALLIDARSHTQLSDVPLAYTVLSWPECSTRYMFGEPIFQDTEATIAELQAISKQAVTNTSVTEALNQPYVATVIGNKSLDEAGDDLDDFTGLIMQKNEATGVATMDGYAGGLRQARFSSEGSVSSGVVTYHSQRSSDPTALTEAGDSVVMDRDGFHTRSWHLYSTLAPEYAYTDGYWVEETSIGTDGVITAGAGSVEIGADGITNYDSEGNPLYSLDDEGLKYKGLPIIDSSNGKINLRVDGAAIDGNLRAVSITLPYVQIDDKGMRTFSHYYWDTDIENYVYDPHDLQCAVGTNGVIIAGGGAVKLDANGLTTYSGAINPTSVDDDTGLIDYSSAVPQCKVTTSGQFIAGDASNGWSILDNTGLKLYTKGADPTAIGSSRNPIVWIDTDGYHMDNSRAYTSSTSQIEPATVNYGTWANYVDKDGDIKANVNLLSNARLNAGPVCRTVDGDGNTTAEYYSVCLHPNGLSTYSYEASGGIVNGVASGTVTATEQCRIDNTGKIIAGAGAVKLDSTGLKTYDIVTTPSTPIMQCSVSTTGAIIGGGGAVKLDSDGLSAYSGNVLLTNVSSAGLTTYLSPASTTTYSDAITMVNRDNSEWMFKVSAIQGMFSETGQQSAYNTVALRVPEGDSTSTNPTLLRIYKHPYGSSGETTINPYEGPFNMRSCSWSMPGATTGVTSGATLYANSYFGSQAEEYSEPKDMIDAINQSANGLYVWGTGFSRTNDTSTLTITGETNLQGVGTAVQGTGAHLRIVARSNSTYCKMTVSGQNAAQSDIFNGYSTSDKSKVLSTSSDTVFDLDLTPTNGPIIHAFKITIEGYGSDNGFFYLGCCALIKEVQVYYTGYPGGAEMRFWDDHMSLCGNTLFLGTIDTSGATYTAQSIANLKSDLADETKSTNGYITTLGGLTICYGKDTSHTTQGTTTITLPKTYLNIYSATATLHDSSSGLSYIFVAGAGSAAVPASGNQIRIIHSASSGFSWIVIGEAY